MQNEQNEPQLSAEMEKLVTEYFDGDIFLLPFGTTQLQGRSRNDRFWSVGKAINPTDIKHFLATALEEQKQSIIQEIVDKYGDYRFVVKKGFGYKIGRTLRFFLLPHFQHKKGDDYENL